ncbi:acyl-CoA dehydrogenase family protein [Paraburkholderia sp. MM5384-R2]|uniref:acyl-CoA dehydrogenase family protein n=1 Tax=Paraburkholderia sp. MM5384-R2 TaxID=2723097 RepID=UPI001612C67C|nr:acyl-CoA dehydrogenase family protein [Paraburkholderia sp. MM5384-R2]MBB5503402.1 acyl-CoA dehydrogenase [Paraburkholderia sp. MM5384-R2]
MSEYFSPWMTPELETFRSTVRRFFEREVAPYAKRWEEQQYVDRSVWREAAEIGMLCTSVPSEYGGVGGSFLHEAIIIEEQARVGDTAFGVVLANMGVPIFLHAATDEQRRRWIPPLTAGESIFAFALTEPGAGSDAKNIATTARRDGEHYVINGSKTFISNGYNGDTVLLAARTSGEGARGISMFMLDTKGLEGYRVGRILEKVGQKGQDTVELFFDNVRVPAENLVGGAEGQGFGQLMSGFCTERTVLGLLGVAQAERAVAITTEYVKNRRAFGRTLFDMQNTRFKLAECQTKTRVARVFIDHCIARVMDGTLDSATAAMAKWWCTELQNTVIDECVQLHGGYGYMTEYPIAKMWADARVQRIYGGANEIQKEVVARSL